MLTDALIRFLNKSRREEPSNIREYVREAYYREETGLEQVPPAVWFRAPKEWEAPEQVEQVYEDLTDI